MGDLQVRSALRLLLAVAILAVSGSAIWTAAASAAAFVGGDLFAVGTDGVSEYSPSGELVQTLPDSAAATTLCFDPSGSHLYVPDVGLYDSSGNLVPDSSWSTQTSVDRCVADSSGHVYSALHPAALEVLNTLGAFLTQLPITATEATPVAIALAPDQCTLYYGSYGPPDAAVRRWNVCTGLPDSDFNSDGFVDDLRVLPNGDVLVVSDSDARLYDSTGTQVVQTYRPPDLVNSVRFGSLDPDGTSLWLCCDAGSVMRFDIASGQLLTSWTPRSGAVQAVDPAPRPSSPPPSSPSTPPSSPITPISTQTPAPTGSRGGPSTSLTNVSTRWPNAMVTLACHGSAGQACAGSVTLRVTEHLQGKRVPAVTASRPAAISSATIAAGSYRIAAGRTATVTVALNATGRRLLTDFHRVPATLVLSGASATRHVTLSRRHRASAGRPARDRTRHPAPARPR